MDVKQTKAKNKKRERIESKRNKAKIAKIVLDNPLQSQRQIAKKAGVTVGTVNNKLNQLKHTKDDRIIGICDKDIEIVELANEVRMGFVMDAFRKKMTYTLLLGLEYDKAYNDRLITTKEYEQLVNGDEEALKEILKNYKLNREETQLIDKISETSQKRYSLFMGNVTDEKGGLNITIDDLYDSKE